MKTEKDKQAFIFYSNMHLLWTSKFTEKITKLYALIHPIRFYWICQLRHAIIIIDFIYLNSWEEDSCCFF